MVTTVMINNLPIFVDMFNVWLFARFVGYGLMDKLIVVIRIN